MSDPNPAILLHLAALSLLVPFAVHRAWTAVRAGGRARRPQVADPPEWPEVTVQLPLFNERYVAERLLRAAFRLDYPPDRLRIQMLDDSTDDTPEIVARTLRRAPRGVRVEHLHRRDRRGYKAGALAEGLARTGSGLLAVFDADFVPGASFLRDLVPHFADPRVGMVQARWGHLNPDFNLLTGMQALLLDGHFAGEQLFRARTGRLFNFNGTAGILRRACIEDAGGWQHDTLTEDLDLSYRAQLRGWRIVYRNDVVCPAELPVDWPSFLVQQHRWARGAVQTGRKLLPAVLRSDLPLASKLEACFHLLGNLAFPLLLLLFVTALPAQLARKSDPASFPLPAWLESALWAMSTVGVALFFLLARWRSGTFALRDLGFLPLLPGIGAALSINNTAAVLGAAWTGGEFRRTPKRNAVGREDGSRGDSSRRYRVRRALVPWFETGLGACLLASASMAAGAGAIVTAAFHLLFAAGLLAAGLASLHLPGRPLPVPTGEEVTP